MDNNAMMFVKKRRVPAKPKEKKRETEKKRSIEKRHPDNPWKVFAVSDPSLYSGLIDDFVENARWNRCYHWHTPEFTFEEIRKLQFVMRTNPRPLKPEEWEKLEDAQYIAFFNYLTNFVPLQVVKKFLTTYYKERTVVPAHVVFKQYIKKNPSVQNVLKTAKKIIESRKAKPLNITGAPSMCSFSKTQQPIVISEYITHTGGSKRKTYPLALPILKHNKNAPFQQYEKMFGGGLLSQCEREYKRAPWMKLFTNKTIRKFLTTNTQFAIDSTFKDETGKIWYKVNKTFYKLSCEGKRKFISNKVAYLTTDNEIIVETLEMYNESVKFDLRKPFREITENSFNVAKIMLMDNPVLKKSFAGTYLDTYVDEIIASFSPTISAHDVARKLSYVLIFLTDLIDGPQSYHKQVEEGLFSGQELIRLDRYTLLPEIFADAKTDKQVVENLIKKGRALIENTYYKLLDEFEFRPEVGRKQTRPTKMGVKKSYSSESCSVVYSPENVKIKSTPRIISNVSNQVNVYEDLAPGLIQKLKVFIFRNISTQCAKCYADVGSSSYSSVDENERKIFCNKECFEAYDFN